MKKKELYKPQLSYEINEYKIIDVDGSIRLGISLVSFRPMSLELRRSVILLKKQ